MDTYLETSNSSILKLFIERIIRSLEALTQMTNVLMKYDGTTNLCKKVRTRSIIIIMPIIILHICLIQTIKGIFTVK